MAELEDSCQAFFQTLLQILRMVSVYRTCVSVLKPKKQTGLWFMFLNVCVDILESSSYRRGAIYSRVGSLQSALLCSDQDHSFIPNLNRIWKVGLLLPDLIQRARNAAVGSQSRDLKHKCANYLLHLEIPVYTASFLPDPEWPAALRMKSQTEITELAKTNPQSMFPQTTHIHMWVEVGNSGKWTDEKRFSSLRFALNL